MEPAPHAQPQPLPLPQPPPPPLHSSATTTTATARPAPQVPELRRRRPGLPIPAGHLAQRHRHHLRGAEQRHARRCAPARGAAGPRLCCKAGSRAAPAPGMPAAPSTPRRPRRKPRRHSAATPRTTHHAPTHTSPPPPHTPTPTPPPRPAGLLTMFHAERSEQGLTNAPDDLPLLSEYDKECLALLARAGYEVDWVNLSYTRSAGDVRQARAFLQVGGRGRARAAGVLAAGAAGAAWVAWSVVRAVAGWAGADCMWWQPPADLLRPAARQPASAARQAAARRPPSLTALYPPPPAPPPAPPPPSPSAWAPPWGWPRWRRAPGCSTSGTCLVRRTRCASAAATWGWTACPRRWRPCRRRWCRCGGGGGAGVGGCGVWGVGCGVWVGGCMGA